jgi:hypothetical protein
MSKLLNHPEVKPLLSDEHFSVDGTLIEAWASHKSFRPKDGSGSDSRPIGSRSICQRVDLSDLKSERCRTIQTVPTI